MNCFVFELYQTSLFTDLNIGTILYLKHNYIPTIEHMKGTIQRSGLSWSLVSSVTGIPSKCRSELMSSLFCFSVFFSGIGILFCLLKHKILFLAYKHLSNYSCMSCFPKYLCIPVAIERGPLKKWFFEIFVIWPFIFSVSEVSIITIR